MNLMCTAITSRIISYTVKLKLHKCGLHPQMWIMWANIVKPGWIWRHRGKWSIAYNLLILEYNILCRHERLYIRGWMSLHFMKKIKYNSFVLLQVQIWIRNEKNVEKFIRPETWSWCGIDPGSIQLNIMHL